MSLTLSQSSANKEIKTKLHQIRLEKELTQYWMAKMIDIPIEIYRDFERYYPPTPQLVHCTEEFFKEFAQQISEFVEVSIEELFNIEIKNDNTVFTIEQLQDNPITPLEYIEYTQLLQLINKSLRLLSPREEKVLRLFFGIGDVEETTDEIAKYFFVKRTQIDQIRMKAINKLYLKLLGNNPKGIEIFLQNFKQFKLPYEKPNHYFRKTTS